MPRKLEGTAYLKKGAWYFAVHTLDKKRVARKVPPNALGVPIDETYARGFAKHMQSLANAGHVFPSKGAPQSKTTPKTRTVLEWCHEWIDGETHESKAHEKAFFDHYLRPYPLAKMPLNEVRTKHVFEWVKSLRAHKVKDGSLASARTVHCVYSPVRRALAAAKTLELIPYNPCNDLPSGTLPEIQDKVPGARATWKFTALEVRLLISSPTIQPDRRVLNALLLLTGMRFGECAALRWRDIDESTPRLARITASRAIASVSKRVKDTKTGATKLVPVIPTLARILAEWRTTGWAKHYKRAPSPDDLVVPTRRMRPRSSDDSARNMGIDCKRAGIPPRKAHAARRTFVSLAQDYGAEASVLRWVTHAPPKEVFGLYTTFAWSRLCETVMAMERALAETLPQTLPPENDDGEKPLKQAASAISVGNSPLPNTRWNPCETVDAVAIAGGICAHSATPIASQVALHRLPESAIWAWGDAALLADLA